MNSRLDQVVIDQIASTQSKVRTIDEISFVAMLAFAYTLILHKLLGMDAFWDTANYHIFLGWAALTGQSYDFGGAAQYHTYLNPLMDVVNYLAFMSNSYIGALLHSLMFCVAMVTLYLISSRIFNTGNAISRINYSAPALVIGATGGMTVSLFGSMTNEHFNAMFVLASLYMAVRYMRSDSYKALAFSGVLIGAAVGLKLSAAPYAVALVVALLVTEKPNVKTILVLGFSSLAGVLVTDGPFMMMRWSETGNPIFPFANDIFKSPYYPAIWQTFVPFDPAKMGAYLKLPVTWLSSGEMSEANTIRDGHMLLAYIGLFLYIGGSIVNKIKPRREELFIGIFFVVAWIVWIYVFRLYRYLVVLEMLTGLILMMGLSKVSVRIPSALKIGAVMALVGAFLISTTVYPNWGRRGWDNHFAEAEIFSALPQDHDIKVLFSDWRLAYMAPELKKAGIPFANLWSQSWYDGIRIVSPIDKNSMDIVRSPDYWFLTYQNEDIRESSPYLKDLFGNDEMECREMKTNMIWSPKACHFVSNL